MRSILVLCVCLFSAVHAATVPAPAPPSFDAKSYILLDYQSGEALAERNADERLAPASITKLMTAYVVFKALAEGQASMDDEVYVSEKAWRMEGSRMFIEVGKRVRLADLLKGMIIQSGNDACVALAEHLAGSEAVFATMMNAEAEALGMHNSHFVNVTGLPDPEHYMSARDIALLARALIRDFPDQYWHYSQKKFTYNNITQYNRNKLLWRDDSVDGLKTGHTESAGYCLVSSAKRDDMRLISAVMGTKGPKARARHSEALLNYGFRFFETHRLYAAGEALIDPRVWMGEPETVPMGLKADLYVTIPRGQYDNLDARIELDSQITAPVHDGQTLGKVVVAFNGEELTQTPLVALQEVPEGGLWRQAVDLVLQWWD
jgi:D-alanyl-D-alanine carboxypeptidase (penicillin-binding protein 5/6)